MRITPEATERGRSTYKVQQSRKGFVAFVVHEYFAASDYVYCKTCDSFQCIHANAVLRALERASQ